jgi:hypothetical protein
MIDYGVGPRDDQAEFVVFGPGFGEALAVHLGGGRWMLVDSCLDEDRKEPASLTYLKQIGVPPDGVKAIVASHWHDDHVRGISKLAETYSSAEFFLPAIFNDKEGLQFLNAYSGAFAPTQARGSTELYRAVNARAVVLPAQARTIIFEDTLNGFPVRVIAMSPSPAAFAKSQAHMFGYIPQSTGSPINHAPELKPNLEAIVLHVDLGHDSLLLGSDLEDGQELGWTAMLQDAICAGRTPASIFKVAHHGSETGHHDDVWRILLKSEVISVLTPFNHGVHRLPNPEDRERLLSLSEQAYISSGASRKPAIPAAQEKRLGDICKKLSRVNSGFGAVRLRKGFEETAWSVELFGAAQPLTTRAA